MLYTRLSGLFFTFNVKQFQSHGTASDAKILEPTIFFCQHYVEGMFLYLTGENAAFNKGKFFKAFFKRIRKLLEHPKLGGLFLDYVDNDASSNISANDVVNGFQNSHDWINDAITLTKLSSLNFEALFEWNMTSVGSQSKQLSIISVFSLENFSLSNLMNSLNEL